MAVRAVRIRSNSSADLFATIAETAPASLVVDIEPLILGWAEPDDRFVARATEFTERATRAAPAVRRIVFASNSARVLAGPPDPRVAVVTRAAKPWRLDFAADLPRPVTVVGDQPATDGALAWRLGGAYCQWTHSGKQPWWPRTQLVFGAVLAPLIFGARRGGR